MNIYLYTLNSVGNGHATHNDNDKRLGLTAKADQPDHKKYNTLKIKMVNKAVRTS